MQSIFLTAIALGSAFLPSLTGAWDPEDIDLATREGWCNAQIAQCPALCADVGKGTRSNGCWPENLYYECVCSDGTRPNLTEYSETIPYYTCRLDQQECIAGCGASDNTCSHQCTLTHVCGATAPTLTNTTSTTTSAKHTATSSKTPGSTAPADSGDGFATTGDSTTTTSGKSAANSILLQVGSVYSLGLMVAGIAVGAFVAL